MFLFDSQSDNAYKYLYPDFIRFWDHKFVHNWQYLFPNNIKNIILYFKLILLFVTNLLFIKEKSDNIEFDNKICKNSREQIFL
jgi:hypothetical protein